MRSALWCSKCNRVNPRNRAEFMEFFFDSWCRCEKKTKKAKKKAKGEA